MVVVATSSNQVKSVIYSKTQLQDWQKSTTQDNQYNIKTFGAYT